MPRDRSNLRHEVVVNGFFASASRKSIKATGKTKVESDAWQSQCWYYFDVIPEFRYAIGWIGNMVSKAKLVVKHKGKIVTEGPAYEALRALYGGPEQQGEMLRLIAMHLSMSGDCWTIAEDGGGAVDDTWDVVSNLRIKASAGWYRLEGESEDLKRKAVVIRFWRPHPLERKKGDSNARAALPVLAELDTLTKRVAADSDSRLTGNGILFIPQEITFPTKTITKEDGTVEVVQREGLDGFNQMLIETAEISMGDQTTAAAKVPIVAQVPGEMIDKIAHITFWSEFDAHTQSLREEAIKRLGTGLDMPPEVLTGTADINHWGAWQVDESAIKVHADPLLKIIVAGLNAGWLWPYLEDENMTEDQAREYVIEADTSEMRLRPNRSKEAFELYREGVLSPLALLRENGFTDDDLPTDDDKIAWLTRKVASGATTPELVEAALRQLGVMLQPREPVGDRQSEARPLPSLQEHPARDIPREEDSESEAAKAAAATVVVYRALERAGNRLKSRGYRLDGVAAADLYRHASVTDADVEDLLTDAWSCLDRFGLEDARDGLHTYTRSLLISRQPLDPGLLASYLRVRVDA
jgi:hypothetical protein